MDAASCHFWLLLLATLLRTPTSSGTCTLSSLQLRSGDRPVDIAPAFSPTEFGYTAVLDFSMDSFSIDAKAVAGCEVSGLPNRAVAAPPAPVGGQETPTLLNIYARETVSGEEQGYRIEVSKLGGSETMVKNLSVIGGTMNPPFKPEDRGPYAVSLAIGYDLIEVAYVLQDNGQKVSSKANPESLPTSTPQPSAGYPATRRLEEAGETQYHERRQTFPVDVGRLRHVALTIESADPMQARVDTYHLDVQREPCSSATPFFDPSSGKCVIHCSQHTYANSAASRCSYCNKNCAVCSSLTHCELCLKDTLHQTYRIRQDGSCEDVHAAFLKKYFWWCASLGLFAVLLVCMGTCCVCQCLCSCCCPSRSDYLSDDD